MTPDFYTLLAGIADKGAVLKPALVLLLDRVLSEGNLTPTQKEQLARLRARVQIDLVDF